MGGRERVEFMLNVEVNVESVLKLYKIRKNVCERINEIKHTGCDNLTTNEEHLSSEIVGR